METIHALLQERNAFETEPFLAVHNSNAALNTTVIEIKHRCDVLLMENESQKDELDRLRFQLNNKGPTKTETRLYEKISKLEEQMNENRDLEEAKINKLKEQLQDAEKEKKLAEIQYDGLKDTITRLQEENESLNKNYGELEMRVLHDKENFVELMNKMNIENEELKKKIEMLMQLNKQEKKRFMWSAKAKEGGDAGDVNLKGEGNVRAFGGSGIVLPSSVSQRIVAHQRQTTSVRYDPSGGDCVATSSEDSTVKVWNTGNGKMLKSFRSGSGNVVLGLDISGNLIAACGSDRMCRIWNIRTERLIHQLVGHSQKVTSSRLIDGDKMVLTASADRSMKVWDITRHTYRQTVTMRHSSTSNCIDISYDSVTAASGHLDGGVRFWDIRTADRTADITELHNNGVTSVNFNPSNNAEVLTTGRDSIVKLIDVRKSGEELQSFRHTDFLIDLTYAACAISPDGKHAAVGSANGDIFIWRTLDGNLERQLKGHDAGVVSVAWDRGGSNGQQFASVDKKGCLLLWA